MLPGEIFLLVAAQRGAELKQGLLQLEKGKESVMIWILVVWVKIPYTLQQFHWNLELKAVCSFEILVTTYQTIRCQSRIP
jgi:hypothetical protein